MCDVPKSNENLWETYIFEKSFLVIKHVKLLNIPVCKLLRFGHCLNTQYHKVRIKGKSGAIQGMALCPSEHLSVVAIEKGDFKSPSMKVTNFTYLYCELLCSVVRNVIQSLLVTKISLFIEDRTAFVSKAFFN